MKGREASASRPAETAPTPFPGSFPASPQTVALKVPRLDGDPGTAKGPASVFIETVNVPLARPIARSGSWYVASP